MDIRYYHQDLLLEIYVGQLQEEVDLIEEANPLLWLSLEEDFTDKDRFAGAQNIAHIINIAMVYPIPQRTMTQDGFYIGVDGCKGGWIAAVLDHGSLRIERHPSVEHIAACYPQFDGFLIDMAIGLRDRANQTRPDNAARAELESKAPTVFPVPCREAVYAEGEDIQKTINLKTLGKSLAKQSIAIIPKIRELDKFLVAHPEYKNVILESHPELAFSRMNGAVVTSRKKEFTGFIEREAVLSSFLENSQLKGLWDRAKELKCSPDDVMDAVCLAVTAALNAHGMCETIPPEPEMDGNGLYMQMVVPWPHAQNQ